MRLMKHLVLAAALLASNAGAFAQDASANYPSNPIHLVTPFAPGATTDFLSRIIADKINADWKVPVIVDNRTGATGYVGAEIVARAPPDGYTLINVVSGHVILRQFIKDMSFDSITGFAPIILLARTPIALVIANNVPVKDTKEFVAYAKANPNKMGYGTSGVGSGVHLAMLQFEERAGIQLIHVPYKGGAPALQDTIAGNTAVSMQGLYTATETIRAGKVRALFNFSAKRSPLFPDLPTAEEVGYPGLVTDEWWAILAPAGTPPAIVSKLNAEIKSIFNQPDVKARIDKLGIEFVGSTPEELGTFMEKERTKNEKLLKDAGVKLE